MALQYLIFYSKNVECAIQHLVDFTEDIELTENLVAKSFI